MPPAFHPSFLPDLDPDGLERRDWARRIFAERRPEGGYKPLRPATPRTARCTRPRALPWRRRWPFRSAGSRARCRLRFSTCPPGAPSCEPGRSDRISRNSLSRRPVFKSSARAACILRREQFLRLHQHPRILLRALRAAGRGGATAISAPRRGRRVPRVRAPARRHRRSNNCTSSLPVFGRAFSFNSSDRLDTGSRCSAQSPPPACRRAACSTCADPRGQRRVGEA